MGYRVQGQDAEVRKISNQGHLQEGSQDVQPSLGVGSSAQREEVIGHGLGPLRY